MTNKNTRPQSSEFRSLTDIEYFDFEEDFVEKNIRCIPMIVRFKMDLAGVKLKLHEWTRFGVDERIHLARMPARSEQEIVSYKIYLTSLIRSRTGREATHLTVDVAPQWAKTGRIPDELREKALEYDLSVSIVKWRLLTDLQRFALIKLCRPGHENKNFSKAAREFGLFKD